MNRMLLVSEESETIRAVIAATRGEDTEVLLAATVAEAIERAPTIEPSVVLLSTSATAGAAAAAIALLRETRALRHAVIALMGSASELAPVKAECDDMLETPLRASDITVRVRNLSKLRSAMTEVERLRGEVTLLQERAPLIPVRDGRSGAFDRRYLDLRLPEEVERTRRYGQPLSLVRVAVADIEDRERNQDRHVVDELLRALGATLQRCVRRVDFVVRLGGAEFVIVAPSTDDVGARILAGRLESAVRALVFRRGLGRPRARPRVRVGTATLHGRDGVTSPGADELLAMANPTEDVPGDASSGTWQRSRQAGSAYSKTTRR